MSRGTRPRRVLAVLLALAALSAGCSTPDSGRASGTPAGTAPATGPFGPCPAGTDHGTVGDQTLPPLRLSCLGGGALDLGRAPGLPTVVNLWASWCGPCREELPLMQQLATAGQGKLSVVGVDSKDGRPQATSFAADAGVSFPTAFDGEGDLMARLGLRALPYTYFLDQYGAIVYTQVGPVTSEEQLRALVAQHLGVQL